MIHCFTRVQHLSFKETNPSGKIINGVDFLAPAIGTVLFRRRTRRPVRREVVGIFEGTLPGKTLALSLPFRVP